ncbi:MAG: ATP-binding protein [Ruminococcus sp.]|nr:ATP-binding protein [Ruminococcus sp.]
MDMGEEFYNIISECYTCGGIYAVSADFRTDGIIQKFISKNPDCSILINSHKKIKKISDIIGEIVGNSEKRSASFRDIIGNLNGKKILIVENSQCLTPDMLEIIRCFLDFFNSRGQTFGILLSGTVSMTDSVFPANILVRIKRKAILKSISNDYVGIDKNSDM